jgi:hypothetical protein
LATRATQEFDGMNPKFFTVEEANALTGFLENALERIGAIDSGILWLLEEIAILKLIVECGADEANRDAVSSTTRRTKSNGGGRDRSSARFGSRLGLHSERRREGVWSISSRFRTTPSSISRGRKVRKRFVSGARFCDADFNVRRRWKDRRLRNIRS